MLSLTKAQLDLLQQKMEAELAYLTKESHAEMSPELKMSYIGIDGIAGDAAVADTMVDIDNAIIGLHLQKISDLNAALERLASNTYAICVDCGGEIAYQRLLAYPAAQRCMDCQNLHEKTYVSEPKRSI
jgi:RNA polymerase-binding transcription factor DksA